MPKDLDQRNLDRIQKEAWQREIIRADKNILWKWIEYYLYHYPELEPPKEYFPKRLFIKMQNELEEMLWKFSDEVEKL
jgi:hypothetical protein